MRLSRVSPMAFVPLDRMSSPRVRKAADRYEIGTNIIDTAQRLYKWWDENHRYLATVKADDNIYADVHAWVIGMLPGDDRRSVVLSTERLDEGDEDYAEPMPGRRVPRRVVVTSDDSRHRSFMLDGHKIISWVVRPEDAGYDAKGRIRIAPDAIVFASRTLAGQRAVESEINRITREAASRRRPLVHLLNNWGSWQHRTDIPLRPLSTVILQAGQVERITADLSGFLDAEAAYVSRGMPWHRGYLFHGPPGTGKTSLARGLAHEFGMDLWYAPLGDLSKDSNLLALLSQVTPRSLLLLEDVDVLRASHDREGAQGEVSMSGLLNALDGVATPHGMVTIMTTNDIDALDPALVRPGRVDRREELAALDSEQAARLFERFYGRPPRVRMSVGGRSAADLAEQFKRSMDDPEHVEAAQA